MKEFHWIQDDDDGLNAALKVRSGGLLSVFDDKTRFDVIIGPQIIQPEFVVTKPEFHGYYWVKHNGIITIGHYDGGLRADGINFGTNAASWAIIGHYSVLAKDEVVVGPHITYPHWPELCILKFFSTHPPLL